MVVLRDEDWAVWEALLELGQERQVALGLAFLDGSSIRAHAKAAGAAKGGPAASRDRREALLTQPWRLWHQGLRDCRCAGAGAFLLMPVQAHERRAALPLLDCLPDVPLWVVGDRIDSAHAFREAVWDKGARPVIPTNPTEPPLACPDWIDANRARVEQLWGRLKEWRAVATRYEKTARSFMGVLCLAATHNWIKA